ncbi:unnamed protein product, partial [Trichogramma brassicae]
MHSNETHRHCHAGSRGRSSSSRNDSPGRAAYEFRNCHAVSIENHPTRKEERHRQHRHNLPNRVDRQSLVQTRELHVGGHRHCASRVEETRKKRRFLAWMSILGSSCIHSEGELHDKFGYFSGGSQWSVTTKSERRTARVYEIYKENNNRSNSAKENQSRNCVMLLMINGGQRCPKSSMTCWCQHVSALYRVPCGTLRQKKLWRIFMLKLLTIYGPLYASKNVMNFSPKVTPTSISSSLIVDPQATGCVKGLFNGDSDLALLAEDSSPTWAFKFFLFSRANLSNACTSSS